MTTSGSHKKLHLPGRLQSLLAPYSPTDSARALVLEISTGIRLAICLLTNEGVNWLQSVGQESGALDERTTCGSTLVVNELESNLL